ncbi:MAG: type IV pilin-like G/H family protein [Coleofasciculus sp. S288]|nr:type IV pilin-like G/H family protein [Coleofasciculus sp. S288]
MSQFVLYRLRRLGSRHTGHALKRTYRIPLWTPSKFIATGLLLALLSTLGTPLIVQSSTPPVAPAQETSEINAAAEQLLGQWQAKDPTSNEEFSFIFAPEGDLFVVLPAPDGTVALKARYQIDPTTQPMQLNIQLSPEQEALTIFEFTEDDQLRLELEGLTPGQSRPTAFRPNAPLFKKISEQTTVPEDIQVIALETLQDPANQTTQKPEDEAKKYMYALTRVQQAHYLEVGKFATAIEDVSIGLRTETELYRYRILPQGDETQSVMIIAEAKNTEIPSYTGAVFVTEVNGETTTVAQICETAQPSTSPPAMPTPPTTGSLDVQCPAGSRALQ